MTAAGKITAAALANGTRVLIHDDGAGRIVPAYRKTGATIATVTGRDAVAGNRRTRYDVHTDRGTVASLSGSQTFWLAPALAGPAPAAPTHDQVPAPADSGPAVPGLVDGVPTDVEDTYDQAGALAAEYAAAHGTPDGLGMAPAALTAATSATRTDIAAYRARRTSAPTPPADVPAPAGAPFRPRVGDVVRVAEMDDTTRTTVYGVDLVAEGVDRLGCGCWRIRSTRPGPTVPDAFTGVEILTGCGVHPDERTRTRADQADPVTAEMITRAHELGRQGYAEGWPAAPAACPEITAMISGWPVGAGAVRVFDAFTRGYAAAADRAAALALQSASIAAVNADVHARACAANPAAAPEVAAMAGGAMLARATAVRKAVDAVVLRQDAGTAVSDVSALADQVDARWQDNPEESVGDRMARMDALCVAVLAEHGHAVNGDALADDRPAAAEPAAAGQDVTDQAGGAYGAPADWYAPEVDSDDGAEFTITHDHEDGTRFDGGSKGDGTLEILRNHRFDWRRGAGVHIPHSRDRFADLVSIDNAAKALRAAGHTVAVELCDFWRPAAVREGHRAARVAVRVDRLAERAEKKEGVSNARRDVARSIGDSMPFGEPIKVGHHSERRHRAAFDKIDRNMRAAIDAADDARRLAGRAAGSESNEAAKRDPRAIMRRIDTMEAEARGWQRELDDDRTGPGRRRRATLELEKVSEDISYQRAKLTAMGEAGTFVAWSRESVRVGDVVNVGGRWCEVARVNQKGVSVRARWEWSTGSDRAEPVKWDDLHGRRRDGMQWDTPNGEPWPIEYAKRVTRWRALAASARHRISGSDDAAMRARITVEHAVRAVLGLPVGATLAEVEAYGQPTTVEGRRGRALAMLAAYERFEAGETFDQVAADLVPLADTTPSWVMPSGATVDVLPADLVPGDIVAGVYDRAFSDGTRLTKSIVGPVESVPKHTDRRESGDWYTVRINGDEHEMRSFRWLAVHREPAAGVDQVDAATAPQTSEPGADVADQDPAALVAADVARWRASRSLATN